jgi:hypothetical protein
MAFSEFRSRANKQISSFSYGMPILSHPKSSRRASSRSYQKCKGPAGKRIHASELVIISRNPAPNHRNFLLHSCTRLVIATMTEQRVAKRKTHTKSRKGCFQCKQRHTKVRVHIRSFRCVLQPITVYYPICCLYPSKWSFKLRSQARQVREGCEASML